MTRFEAELIDALLKMQVRAANAESREREALSMLDRVISFSQGSYQNLGGSHERQPSSLKANVLCMCGSRLTRKGVCINPLHTVRMERSA